MADPSATSPGSTVTRTRYRVAPADWQVRIITGLFAVSLIWFGGEVVLSLILGTRPDVRFLIFAVLVAGAMLWRWMNSVRGYVVETGGADGPRLLIRRVAPWALVPVPLGRLRSVDATRSIRSILNMNRLGLGSLFGWAGTASVPDVGPVLAYATNARRVVLLELAPRAEEKYRTSDGSVPRGPIVLISPSDPAALAAALAPLCPPAVATLASVAKPPRLAAAPRKKRR